MTEYGRIHTDGSRSGGQPLIKTQHCPNCEAQATEIERLRIEAEAQYDRGYYDGRTRQPTQSDALVAALEGVTFDHYPPNDAKTIRAALDAAGFEIREKSNDQ